MMLPRNLLSTTCLTATLISMGAGSALANPEGGVVTAGQASIIQTDKKLDIIQQSNKAVIDWRGFDIGFDEHTEFFQPNSGSLALNRVNSTSPSYINGKLTANGNIMIINQNGLLFGNGAQVDVNGLVATTADIDNDKFMNSNGVLDFNKSGNPGAVVMNAGYINVKDEGLVGLVAPNVVNTGIITAKLGRVHLASGDTATVDMYGDGLIKVAVSDDVKSQIVANSGYIQADGGKIAMTAAAGKNIVNSLISQSGALQARSVSQKNGEIIISAAGSNSVEKNIAADKGVKEGKSTAIISGVLDVSGRGVGERGGKVVVTGDDIALLDGTFIDASGHTGLSNTTEGKLISDHRVDSAGGEILIGGDYLGQGETSTAKNLFVDDGVLVLNDSTFEGDAGRTIFWSDDTTQFYGNVYARALGGLTSDTDTWNATLGGNTGDGGFVETSGHGHLDAGGYVDLTASNGDRGTYFLDPTNITIYGNFLPNYVSTGGAIDLSTNLKVWLDASDTNNVNLTYNSLATTATGISGQNTITVSANTGLAVGARIRLGGAGAVTAADTVGADTYTITAINGNTITLSSNLTTNYNGGAGNDGIYQGYVSQLTDKSSQANNASQGTAGQMPLWISNGLNGLGVARFDGAITGDYLQSSNSLDLTGGFSVFHVSEVDTAKDFNGIFRVSSTATGANDDLEIYWQTGSNSGNMVTVVNRGDPAFAGIVSNNGLPTTGVYGINASISSNFAQYINGTLRPVDNAVLNQAALPVSANKYYVGVGVGGYADMFLDGEISELIVYNAALSADAQTLVNQYQSAKWNLALTPPGAGLTENAKATDANGYSVFTTRYLERLSQSANVSLQATNDINLDLKGDTLALTSGRNLTLTAGRDILSASAGTIQTSGVGGITLNATRDVNFAHNVNLIAGSGGVTVNAGRDIKFASTAINTSAGNGAVSLTAVGNAFLNGINSGTGDVTIGAYDVTMYGGSSVRPDSLVGYWKLDENTGTSTADSSGGTSNGTVTSGWGTAAPTPAANNSSLLNGRVDITNTPALNLNDNFTISTWVRTTNAGTEQVIYSNENSTATTGWHLEIYQGKPLLQVYPSGAYIQSSATLADNTWYHVAATFSGGTVTYYVNGVAAGGGSIGAIGAKNDSTPAKIGALFQNGLPWNGNLDDVRLYNTALSANDITGLYSSAPTWNTGTLTVNASHDINLDLQGDAITAGTNKNITLTATTGQITSSSVGAIQSAGAGNITLNAGTDVNFAHDFDLIAPGAGTVSVNAGNSILYSGGGDITTTGGTITLTSDSDSSGLGAISLGTGTNLASSGGNVLLTGGNGYARGTATNAAGILLSSASINSGNGTITLNGFGNTTANIGNQHGIWVNSSTLQSTGGNITLAGFGGNRTTAGDSSWGNIGVYLKGAIITSATGDTQITGTSGTGNLAENTGVVIYGATAISSTGAGATAGDITISGINNSAVNNNQYGIWFGNNASTNVSTIDGDIIISGTSTAPGGSSHGIVFYGTASYGTSSSGDGNITFNASSANATDALFRTGEFRIGGALNTGNITINANSLNLSITPLLTTKGTVTFAPRSGPTSIGVKGGGGALQLTTALLNAVTASNVVIGHATHAGAITLGSNWDLTGLAGAAGVYNLTFNTAGTFNSNGFTVNLGRDAVSFDGVDDYLHVVNGYDTFSGDDTTSVSFWLDARSLANNPVFLSSEDGGYYDLFYGSLNDGSIFWAQGGNNYRLHTPGSIPINTWNHVVFVKTGATTGNLYINGTLIGSTSGAIDGTSAVATSDMLIGRFKNAGGELNGLMDDIRFYNTSLSAGDIATLYNGGAGGAFTTNDAGLRAAYNFSEGTGGSSTDKAGISNAATFNNGAAWVRAKNFTVNAGGNITLGKVYGDGSDITITGGADVTLADKVAAMGDGTVSISAANSILLNASSSINSGGTNITLTSDSDSSGLGAISLASGSSIISNGGNITLTGGNGYARGTASNAAGIKLVTATVNAGGGHITMNGASANGLVNSCTSAPAQICNGVEINTSTVSTSGAGMISLDGILGDNSHYTSGIYIYNSSLTNVSGALTLNASGTSNYTGTLYGERYGVLLYQNAIVQSTSGPINITSNITSSHNSAVVAGGSAVGVMAYNGGKITSATGNITINGTSTVNTANANSNGVAIADGFVVSSTGTGISAGTVTINGAGVGNATTKWGVSLTSGNNGSPKITSIDGAINITGTTSGTTPGSIALYVRKWAGVAPAIIESTGSAGITLTAAGNAATDLSDTATALTIGGAFNTGNITINANNITLSAPTIRTSGTVTFAPRSGPTSIGVKGGAGALQLTTGLLNAVTASNVVIGHATHAGAITLGANWDLTGAAGVAGVYDLTFNTAGTFNSNGFTVNLGRDDAWLDGVNDYAGTVGTASDLSFIQNSGVFTISVWVFNYNTSGETPIIANTATSGQKGFYLSYNNNAANLTLNTAGGGPGMTLLSTSANSLTANAWNHITITGDGTTLRSYINGVANNTSTINALTTGDSTNLATIGMYNPGSVLPKFKGEIDDVKIYNTTLSAGDAAALYNGGAGSNPTLAGLRLAYNFAEGTGTNAADSSGGPIGSTTMQNGATWARGKNFTVNAGGAVTLGKVIGDGSDIAVTGNSVTLTDKVAAMGDGTLGITAAGNIALNTGSSANTGTGNLTLNAGNLLTTTGTADIDSGGGNVSLTGTSGIILGNTITLDTNGGNITFNSPITSTVAQSWDAGTGNITLNGTYTGTSGNLTLTANQLDINNIINVGTNTITLKPGSAKNIRVGRSTDDGDDATYLDISQPELARLQAGSVVIGDAALASATTIAGNFDLTGIAGAAGVYNLTFNTAGTFDSSGFTVNLGRDALDFDGVTDYVTIADNDSLDITGAVSVSMWVKGGSTANKVIMEKGTNAALVIQSVNANYTHYHTTSGNGFDVAGGTAAILDDTWHLVTYTYNGAATKRIYVDGVLVDTETAIAAVANASPLTIGARANGSFSFDGMIDDVRIYSTALTAGEITALYNSGAGAALVNTTGLNAGYNFGDGTGTTATDVTGTNNGAITGTTWVRAKDLTVNAGGAVTLGKIHGDGSTITVAGGADVTLTDKVAAMGDGTVSISAANSILLNTGSSINTGGGNITLTSDSDSSGTGAISLVSGTSILSNGGNILLTGGNGYARGTTTNAAGISLTSATINSGAGNIVLNGFGNTTGNVADQHGIVLGGASSLLSTSGNITLTGFGGSGTTDATLPIPGSGNMGTLMYGSSSISSATGDITIAGTAGTGAHVWNIGAFFYGTSTVSSTGTGVNAGDISITGTNAAAPFDYQAGIKLQGLSISAVDGDISINGTTSSTINQSYATILAGMGILSTGDSNITFTSTTPGIYDLLFNTATTTIGGANAAGNITFNANAIDPQNTPVIRTSGTVTFAPRSGPTSIGVKGGAGNLQLTTALLNAVTASNLVIGHATHAGAITLGSNWDLTGAAGSAGVYDLTFNTASTFNSNGFTVNLGRDALSFDGINDYVRIADNNSLDITGPSTLSMWVRGSSLANKVIAEKGTDGNFIMQPLGNTFFYENVPNPSTSASPSILDNSWHLVSTVYDGATKYLYVDGVLVHSAAMNAPTANNDALTFGARDGGIAAFAGNIDDIRLYNTALSANDLLALYNSGAGSFSGNTGLAAAYNFSEGSGTTAADTSANSNTGTLTNAPTWIRAKNFTVNATGAITLGDVYGDGSDISATGSNVTVAGKVAAMGDGILNLESTNNITLNSGSSLNTGSGNLILAADNQITTAGAGTISSGSGNIILTATNGIVLSHATAINNTSGNITFNNAVTSATAQSFNAGTGNLTFNNTYTGTSGNLTLTANQLDINNTVDVGTNTLTMKPGSAKAIRVGRSTDNGDDATYLDISAPELARIKAGTVSIGDAALASAVTIAGNMDLTGAANAAGVYNLTFNTAGTFDSRGFTVNLGRDAVNLDGVNDYLHIVNGYDTFSGDDTTSMSFWFNARDLSNSPVFFSSEDGGYYDLFYETSPTTGFYWAQGGNNYKTYGPSFSLNSWNHAVFVKTGATTGDLYLNGVLLGSATGSIDGTSPTAVSDLLIGKFKNAGYNFNGLLDDIRFYNTAISSDNVTTLYNSGAGAAFTTNDTGLRGAYNFSEGTGTSSTDKAGIQNVANLISGPTWARAKNLTVNAGGAALLGKIHGDGSDIAVTGSSVSVTDKVAAMGDGTLSLTGTAGNITFSNDASANTDTGTLTLNANQQLTAGTGTDIRSNSGNINLTAGNGFNLNNVFAVNSNSGNITFNSNITSGASQSWNAGTGNLTLNGTYTGTAGSLTLTANQLDINNIVDVGNNTLVLKPSTAKNIRVGRSTDNGDDGTFFDISRPELARLKAGTVTIGDAALASATTIAGNLDLTGAANAAGVFNLTFNTAGTFNSNGFTMNLGRDAVSFDGADDYVAIPGTPSDLSFIQNTGVFAISTWVYYTGAGQSGILGSTGTTVEKGIFLTYEADGRARLALLNGIDGAPALDLSTTVGSLTENAWNHIVMTGDGTTARSYINGVANNTAAIGTLSTGDSNRLLTLGNINSTAPSHYFQGNIDDVRIYNTAIDATAVAALYNGGAGNTPTINGLQLAYGFGEGSGTSAADSSAVTGAATLTNSPAWLRAKNLIVNAGGAVVLGDIHGDGSDINITGSAVTLAGKVAAMGDGTLNIGSTNNITINNGASANAGGAGTSLILHTSAGNFINNAGATALAADNGRWLVYSTNPTGTTGEETLSSNFNRYSCTYGGSCPALGTGNGLLYSFTPTLTATAAAATVQYGNAVNLNGYSYILSGYIGTDASADNVTGTLVGTSTYTAGNNAGGTYNIDYTSGTLASAMGYSVTTYASNATGLTVTARAITVKADDKTKIAGEVDPALTYQITVGTLYNTDSLSGALARAAGETAGTYAIGIGTLAASANYNLSYISASFDITAGTGNPGNLGNTITNPESVPSTVTQVSQDPNLNLASNTYGGTVFEHSNPLIPTPSNSGSSLGESILSPSADSVKKSGNYNQKKVKRRYFRKTAEADNSGRSLLRIDPRLAKKLKITNLTYR